MSKKRKKMRKKPIKTNKKDNTNDIYSLILFASAFLVIIFVFTSTTGFIGKYINILLRYGFGLGGNVFAFFLIAMAIYLLKSKSGQNKHFATGLTIIFISTLSLIHLSNNINLMFTRVNMTNGGGIIGAMLAYSFKFLLGANASYVIFSASIGASLLLLTNKSISELWQTVTGKAVKIKNKIDEKPKSEKLTQKVEKLKRITINTKSIEPLDDPDPIQDEQFNQETIEISKPKEDGGYQLPPLSIFPLTKKVEMSDKRNIKDNIRVLNKTLSDFDVDARISKVVTGPTVTRYEIELASGVKVNKILALADDIALAFATPDVRILAPIPGKSAIGIEVPNSHRELVTIGDILSSEKMKNSKSLLTIAIGKDISGRAVIANLAQMPHLLIAGATGSGKSVCLNSIIATLISRATPKELRMILIDPKRVELNIFNDIPHLITPVVTNPKRAANALEWAVGEMESRYEILAEKGVKNITGYNALMGKKGADGMPVITVIIDELADLMMVASREVEDAICRLAQLARAVGIHLVIASQRPSTDVITGLIKANITNRIAFAVSSQIDSRVILDAKGAEKLIGKGDMLISTPQSIKPKRVQAAFITEKEIESLCKHVKSYGKPEYVQSVIAQKKSEFSMDDYEDEFYDRAVEVVVSSNKASVSYLQRRLRIGYGRAARLMDALEEKGIVGPQDGARPRDVLMTKEELSTLSVE